MSNNPIEIAVLTSSRADYGIYKPLLLKLKNNDRFNLTIVVFGMHLQNKHGNTINSIKTDFNSQIKTVDGMPINDTPLAISQGYASVHMSFSKFWSENHYDWIIALGDRFEMSAAVQSTIPFELKVAHIHGGETTLGSTDNIYRDQISLVSSLHFASSDLFVERLKKLVHNNKEIYNVGSLSLDGIDEVKLPNWDDVCLKFNIPKKPFILVTFHPETVGLENNVKYIEILRRSISFLCKSINIIITLANADALGELYRDLALELSKTFPKNISVISSFGKENYFAAIKASKFLLGNTSSGIIEAASFNKYVLNVGNRQLGRLKSANVIDVPFDYDLIIEKSISLINSKCFDGINVYAQKNTSKKIISRILNYKN